jgi:hypothetical protein
MPVGLVLKMLAMMADPPCPNSKDGQHDLVMWSGANRCRLCGYTPR